MSTEDVLAPDPLAAELAVLEEPVLLPPQPATQAATAIGRQAPSRRVRWRRRGLVSGEAVRLFMRLSVATETAAHQTESHGARDP